MWGTIAVGTHVDIKRSDGRVHPAVVSGLNSDAATLTVEWFENEETKGKEIDLAMIRELNASLFREKQAALSAASDPVVPRAKVKKPVAIDFMGSPAVKSKKKPSIGANRRDSKPLAPKNLIQKPSSASAQASLADLPPVSAPLPSQVEKIKAKKRDSSGSSRRSSNPGKASKCVGEIQRIEQRREQRRAKQVTDLKEAKQYNLGENQQFKSMIDKFKESLQVFPRDISAIPSSDDISKITVCVRKRPLSKKEKAAKQVDVCTMPDPENTIIHEPKQKVDLTKYLDNHQFRFDQSFDENCDNETVYNFSAKPLVETIFDRGMATCFAYGQTGSGKTHTMGGDFSSGRVAGSTGIYAFAARDVFELIKKPENKAQGLTVGCSFFEIYGGKVYDLLNSKARLRVLEDGGNKVNIVGLSEKVVSDMEDVLSLIQYGNDIRTQGTTSANEHSSRSHAVFQIILRKKKTAKVHGKFSLIDLAGNERGSDAATASRQVRMEGAEINKSLLALKECIRALGKKGAHLPFRASKLTQVLKDSFIGARARTCMIAMVSPGQNSCEFTLNTLRYADRVKELKAGSRKKAGPIQHRAVVNDDEYDASSPIPDSLGSTAKEDMALILPGEEEVLQYHEAINKVVDLEDEIVEEHKKVLAMDKEWSIKEQRLLKSIDNPDTDAAEYANALDDILRQKIEEYSVIRENLAKYKDMLEAEEILGKKVKNSPNGKNTFV